MSKPWAKIIVDRSGTNFSVTLDSDAPWLWTRSYTKTRQAAISRARAWARRLGDIPVEVEE